MKKPIADLHCHPSLKPHLNAEIGSIWEYRENPTVDEVFRLVSFRKLAIRGLAAKMALKTQSNLDSCLQGGNRLLFCSIYPFEREFMRPDRPFKRASLVVKWALQALLRKRYKRHIDSKLIRLITGISPSAAIRFLDQIHTPGGRVDYMQGYLDEYNYLLAAQGERPGAPQDGTRPAFRLLSDASQLPQESDENTLSGIITAEGAHAFGDYALEFLRKEMAFGDLPEAEQARLRASFRRNLAIVKDADQTAFPPFFVTFSHHFHNFLSGHSQSFAGLFSKVFNQEPGMDAGLSALGREVLELLLERGPRSARILIDTKHMSPRVRQEYYALVRQRRQQGDAIPIVSSHSAVNALDTLETAMRNNNDSRTERRSYVSKFEINLTDEDIRETFDSGGIIGICMHDGRMPGRQFKKKLRAVRAHPEKAKRLYSQMFLTNIFHIVKVNARHLQALHPGGAGEAVMQTAWDTVSLGSDNDGIVDPFNTYETAATLTDFRLKIIEAMQTQDRPYMKDFRILSLPEEKPMEPEELQALMMGLTPEAIADRVFYDNARIFLERYFTEAYRFSGAVV
ncbi:hypothetical protein OZ410_07635 [Robiginitalea sp. M366]|uniref:hypothetical protein n=1 Tax=Robiginitalea aestuariiviva TaxID=3036903 RepID=UPI00240D98AD|nr:hypothetical protein [Robiginitalea aestuariiviva]MDG1572184.1 hypothetical protein [Robiginitalea aestuariiviva]